jgi:hypothetical protein
MKRCPTCNRTYSDRDLSFCIDDGTPLVAVPDEDSTVVSPSSRAGEASAPGSHPYGDSRKAPAYQPPGSYVAPELKRSLSAWPWVIGIVAVILIGIVGFGVAAAFLLPRLLRASVNRNQAPINVNVGTLENSNSNLNLNTNSNVSEVESEPPTDSTIVLSDLTDLEHQWTVANINADKKALDRILADDYVGITDGKAQGKAEYIKTIRRDTSIEKWDFEDLKVDLAGYRATLTGILKLVIGGQENRFHFTDKFVWRDGRWQATGSEVSQTTDVNN